MPRTWLLVAFALVALAVPAAASANGVTDWNRIATDTLVAMPPAAGGAAPAMQINMAMTQGAVYDAVNAIGGKREHQPYLLKRHFGWKASKDAAVATAAYRVLSSILNGVPPTIAFPNRAALQLALDASHASSLGAIPDSPFKSQGIRAGDDAADAMIAARTGDGRFGPSQWVPYTGAGYWQPLLNPDGTPMLDPTPWVGGVRPFVLKGPSQFRTAGPNALTSGQWVAEYKEVKDIGSLNSATRSGPQTHNALFWQSNGGPAYLWNGTARSLVAGYDLDDSARLLAMLNIAGADAAINCWNDKYYFDFWRPWNAIRGDDRNTATDSDPSWTPLLSAPYPEHPSGHLCLDGAELRVFQMFFGTDNVPFGVTSTRFNNETRFFDSFSAALNEITEARIWAGLHFRTADLQGRGLGRNVAEYMAAHYFQPEHGDD
jgi:hypothetical protein